MTLATCRNTFFVFFAGLAHCLDLLISSPESLRGFTSSVPTENIESYLSYSECSIFHYLSVEMAPINFYSFLYILPKIYIFILLF